MSDNISILIDAVVQEMGLNEEVGANTDILNFIGKIGRVAFGVPSLGDATLIIVINLIAHRYRHQEPEELSAFMAKLNKAVRTCVSDRNEDA